MKKTSIILASVLAAASASATVSFSGTAMQNFGAGTLFAPGNTSVIIVDTGSDGFGSFVTSTINVGDTFAVNDILVGDQVIGANATQGSLGVVAAVPGTASFSATAGLSFGILVFENQTDLGSAQAGSTYQFFTDASWIVPADSSSATFGSTFTQLSGVSSASLGVVPEPSTYAALAGLCALSFVMVRRRRA
jgi:hypothetical protein